MFSCCVCFNTSNNSLNILLGALQDLHMDAAKRHEENLRRKHDEARHAISVPAGVAPAPSPEGS